MKKLYIDADTLLHEVVSHFEYTKKEFKDFEADEGEDLGLKPVEKKVDMKAAKKMFLHKVHDILGSCEIEMSLNSDYPRFNGVVCVFTDSSNFRYDIFPDYKKRRKDKTRSKEFHKLKKWAIKKHGILFKNTEADEVVHYYARKGNPIASMDKDVYKQTHKVPVYDLYNKCFQKQTKEQAKNFMLIQSLMGDSTDDIPAIVGVGEAGAKKLLDTFGWNWNGVVKAYESKGQTEADAILTRNLVDMSVFKGKKKGVVLYTKANKALEC